jgi:hypothetical protein
VVARSRSSSGPQGRLSVDDARDDGKVDTGSDSPLVDRALLAALDEALGAVAAAIPWAERDSNRVVWHEGSSATPAWVPTWATGVCELFEACAEIEMADVGNGWFVHPLESGPPDDPFVPREVARSGPCFPLGTDGGGGWFVVGDDGVVWRLPPGLLRDGVYDPAPGQPVEHVASSVRGFVELMHALAVEASTCDDE